jgi:formylglycine-generating enzyme required for sulfatase activity
MYAQYLRCIKKDKGDRELYRQEKERREEMERHGTFTWNSASPSYDVDNESLLWTGRTPPEGKSSFPVALVRYSDATGFCTWLTKRHPEMGEFRLPTKEEWTIAAYGDKRKYPWGNQWDIDIPCVSKSEQKRRSSPVSVKDPTGDVTPEGIRHLWGNVREYIQNPWASWDVFWMGPHFKTSPDPEKDGWPLVPLNDWWGYTHNGSTRMETLGFRVVLDTEQHHTTTKSTLSSGAALGAAPDKE